MERRANISHEVIFSRIDGLEQTNRSEDSAPKESNDSVFDVLVALCEKVPSLRQFNVPSISLNRDNNHGPQSTHLVLGTHPPSIEFPTLTKKKNVITIFIQRTPAAAAASSVPRVAPHAGTPAELPHVSRTITQPTPNPTDVHQTRKPKEPSPYPFIKGGKVPNTLASKASPLLTNDSTG